MRVKGERKSTGLLCPISNTPLYWTGTEAPYVLDGDSFYESADGTIKYTKNARSMYFVHNGRYFLPVDAYLVEYVETFLGVMVPITATHEEKRIQVEIELEKRKRRRAEHLQWIKDNPVKHAENEKLWEDIAKNTIKVTASSIPAEFVQVQPMKPPLGVINYMDFAYPETEKPRKWYQKIFEIFKF